MGKFVDITGKTFGRWTVVGRAERPAIGSTWWVCRCECGTVHEVPKNRLTQGRSKSCGCLARELTSSRRKQHGMTGTKIHNVWLGIISRTTNPKHARYADWGGRGIRVCERWSDFEAFLSDMESTYAEGLSLERIDNDGPYSPENCRWATAKEQTRNRRSARIITYQGRTQSLAEWCEELCINRSTAHHRLSVLSWSAEKTFETPVRKRTTSR